MYPCWCNSAKSTLVLNVIFLPSLHSVMLLLDIVQKLAKEGQSVVLRSQHEKLKPGTNIYVVDSLGELRHLYTLSPIAVIGGSFLPSLSGHNISEAAAAGCAILTGCHVGHFSHMVLEMQRLNPLSVLQVSGKLELEKALIELLTNATLLEARRRAAKEAFDLLSSDIVSNIWNLLNFHIFSRQSSEETKDCMRNEASSGHNSN
ncbi:putative transferase [Lupinus albus]|uniref:Putative transferase n=1 Tax=Lupinus albus TaxID=3870 RepID=A0A6A4NTV9_LUPAL|nr:putative transferase [Lupinus albus]